MRQDRRGAYRRGRGHVGTPRRRVDDRPARATQAEIRRAIQAVDPEQPELDRRRIGYADEVKGLLNSGRMTEDYLLAALDRLEDGVTEIYFHPGCYPDEELRKWMPDYCHEEELAALTSPRVMKKLNSMGIVLKNYRGDEKKVDRLKTEG